MKPPQLTWPQVCASNHIKQGSDPGLREALKSLDYCGLARLEKKPQESSPYSKEISINVCKNKWPQKLLVSMHQHFLNKNRFCGNILPSSSCFFYHRYRLKWGRKLFWGKVIYRQMAELWPRFSLHQWKPETTLWSIERQKPLWYLSSNRTSCSRVTAWVLHVSLLLMHF